MYSNMIGLERSQFCLLCCTRYRQGILLNSQVSAGMPIAIIYVVHSGTQKIAVQFLIEWHTPLKHPKCSMVGMPSHLEHLMFLWKCS